MLGFFSLGWLGFLSLTALASDPLFPKVDITDVSLTDSPTAIVLDFQDREKVTGVCGLFLRSQVYFDSTIVAAGKEGPALLLFPQGSEPCLNDRVGKRTGRAVWGLPDNLRAGGRFFLVINDELLGEIVIESAAQSTSIDAGASVRFLPLASKANQ